jgi:L-asparagine transporter-like permease
MNYALIAGVLALFVSLMINRSVLAGALRKLDDAAKLRLIDKVSKKGMFSNIVFFAIVILYVSAILMYPERSGVFTIVYACVLGIFLVFNFFRNYRMLRNAEMPAEYIKSFLTGYSIFGIGLLILAGCLYWGLFAR